MNNWIRRIIFSCGQRPWMVLLLFAVMTIFSVRTIQDSSLDALPDLSDPQVIVLSDWSGQSPELMDEQVAQPISSALLSVPNVASIRSQSFFGISFVYAIFDESTDLYWARSRVQ